MCVEAVEEDCGADDVVSPGDAQLGVDEAEAVGAA